MGGGPGSGKGTQCENIARRFGYEHLSSGDILRSEVMSGSKRGQQLYMLMAAGNKVDNHIIDDLLGEAMVAKADGAKGFLIDGFPINEGQASNFEEDIGKPSMVIAFEAGDEVLKQRLKKRNNFDDNEDSINKRLATSTRTPNLCLPNTMPKLSARKTERLMRF